MFSTSGGGLTRDFTSRSVGSGREGSLALATGRSYTVDSTSRSVGSGSVISLRIVDTDGPLTEWASSTQALDDGTREHWKHRKHSQSRSAPDCTAAL